MVREKRLTAQLTLYKGSNPVYNNFFTRFLLNYFTAPILVSNAKRSIARQMGFIN
jgi:hypothetical protein